MESELLWKMFFIWLFKKNLFFLISLKLRQGAHSPDKTALLISVCWQGSALGITGAVSDKCKLEVGIALGFDSGQGHASQSSAGIKMCL